MRNRAGGIGAATLLVTTLVCCAMARADGPTAGSRRVDFALVDDRGRAHSAAEWKGSRAVVLVFLGLECPVSNGYAPEFTRIVEAYGSRGVAFYGIHADPDVTAEAARAHAAEYGLSFPILLDPTQGVARQAGVRVTPEAVVLDSEGQILYRGRIDDRYTPQGKRRPGPTTLDLRNALDATLVGLPPAPASAGAFGCRLPRVAPPTTEIPDRGTRP